MKKWIVFFLAIAICIISFTGCVTQEERLNANIEKLEVKSLELQEEISALESEKSALQDDIIDLKVEAGTAKYVLTINIRQSHCTLDIGEHLKDSMNDISIQIPVDKEYFDSLSVGDTINNSFRMGSFIFKGSFGNWKITVADKEIR